ncbi:39S ribosomal protein L49, mitochondrial [Myiozetetes cayanensis]|uniref:39S ribosomal protein L49, mitochondrial n=1 Tax=Myiozetetes cayanensis TaxID=478635 RepID=UPI00215E67F8|nr:39S ribosomal protein L49, mitochondrial [Myiozetetes cayanensis]
MAAGAEAMARAPGPEESRAEFASVERLLPHPHPRPPHTLPPHPMGWSPPQCVQPLGVSSHLPPGPPPGVPYFVRRSRYHNLPVYLGVRRGNRRETTLRGLSGDLWALERDLRAFLGVPELQVQVNEVSGTLRLKGHWGAELRAWLLQGGF